MERSRKKRDVHTHAETETYESHGSATTTRSLAKTEIFPITLSPVV